MACKSNRIFGKIFHNVAFLAAAGQKLIRVCSPSFFGHRLEFDDGQVSTALSFFGQYMSACFYRLQHIKPVAMTVFFVVTVLQFGYVIFGQKNFILIQPFAVEWGACSFDRLSRVHIAIAIKFKGKKRRL
jgi:hypothetical protein